MKIRLFLLPALLLMASCGGQPSTPSAGTASAGTASANSAIIGTPASGSKFSRIRIGMGKREIQDIIGTPNDQGSHITGKAFIPFYFGSGTTEIDAHYKGEGILTYASRGVGDTSYQLVGMKVDSGESGYVR